MKCLVSAESANNAGSVSCLIPMLILAIPIVFSEAIFLSVVETKGFSSANSLDMFAQYWWVALIFLFLVNIVNWLIAGTLYNHLILLYNKLSRNMYIVVGVMCVVLVLWTGYREYQTLFNVITFAVALVIGLATQKYDNEKFVFVYTYFVTTMVTDEIYRQFFI
jgi:TctA family transporter